MISVEVRHYLGRARDLLKGMERLREQQDAYNFHYSQALLGIHGAISYCDALRVGLGSKSLSSGDHSSAIKDLQQRLSDRKFENRDGTNGLGRLVAKKSKIA